LSQTEEPLQNRRNGKESRKKNGESKGQIEKKKGINTPGQEKKLEKATPNSLDLLNLKVAGDGLPELLDHLGLLDNKSVEVTRAADLELGDLAGLLDAHLSGILSAESSGEGLNVSKLFRHLVLNKKFSFH